MLEGFNTSGSIIAEHIGFALEMNLWLSIVLFLSVVGPMLYLAWKYRADKVKDEDIENVTHHLLLEITWTTIPTIMMFTFFYYGYTSMVTARTMPPANESIIIAVEGKKWSWNHTYPANANGFVHKTAELYAPANKNVILEMTAPLNDVIHSYFVPAFRMKEDVVPGRITKQWFNANEGTYDIECAEYCGTSHAYMLSKINIIPQADYDAWISSQDSKPAAFATGASKGQELFESNGCNGCHSVTDDSILIGPSLMGIAKGKTAQYLKDAIINPNKDIADGFSAMMPATKMSDEDIAEVYSYIATAAVAKGAAIIESNGCMGCHTTDGTPSAGPSFKGMGTLDAGYIKDAILAPNKDIAEGFSPIMPATTMSDDEIAEVTKYLKAL